MSDQRYEATAVRAAAAQLGGDLGAFLIAAATLLEVRRNRDCKPCAKSYYQYNMELEEAWRALRAAADKL